jgi:uncharacterized protein (DUF58 family)
VGPREPSAPRPSPAFREVVERAAAGLALALPRGPQRGKVGEVRAASVGSSLELHDFRAYQPGDDLRQVDWNARARLGELVVRVRQDEVSPRVEVLLDASASMGLSPAKAARAREVAGWVCALARRASLTPTALVLGEGLTRAHGAGQALDALGGAALDGTQGFEALFGRRPEGGRVGVRVVVSDFLFEAVPLPLARRLARGASGLALVQVLDEEDLAPTGAGGVRLVDAESGEALERFLTGPLVEQYQARLAAHLELWATAARAVQARWLSVSAARPLEALARAELRALAVPVGGGR